MKPRDIFLTKLKRGTAPRIATGSVTSIVTTDLMEKVGVFFPEAHQVPEQMARLAAAGYTELGFDNVMPLFSVWHESAALGCEVNWGDRLALMGGTSNINLIRNGTAELITQDVQEKIAAGIDIIGPECAVPLDAPMKNLVWLAREAKRLGSNQS